jgi:hypothetical protein
MKQSFPAWMDKIDAALMKKAGVTHHDLADYCYMDAYADGERPASVAKKVLEAEGYYD